MSLYREASQVQETKPLSAAYLVIVRTAESWTKIQELSGLPDALYIVGDILPYFPILLRSLETYLNNIKDAKELMEKITDVYQFAELCQKQAKYFDSIFKAITANDNFTPKGEKYRIAAEKCGGVAIEVVMKELLQRATTLAATLPGDDDLKTWLKAAAEEVNKLKPSLAEPSKGYVSLKNYGEGNQFYHGGKGHQNHCAGGIQITGDGATNNLGAELYGRNGR